MFPPHHPPTATQLRQTNFFLNTLSFGCVLNTKMDVIVIILDNWFLNCGTIS